MSGAPLPLTPAGLGLVLAAMSNYALERAKLRKSDLGRENSELLYAIAFTLEAGMTECLRIAERQS